MSKFLFLSDARGDDEAFFTRQHANLTASMPARGLTFRREIRDGIDAHERKAER